MTRMVKEFVEVRDHVSLDALIENLIAIRDGLPVPGEAEVRMRGDDVFGRQLSITYDRPQTEEEAACDARYADAFRQARRLEAGRIEQQLGLQRRSRRGGLRAVA